MKLNEAKQILKKNGYIFIKESNEIGTYGVGSWEYTGNCCSISINCYAADMEDDADAIYPYEAEVLVTPCEGCDLKDQYGEFYEEAHQIVHSDDSMNDTYDDGESLIGKFDFFFENDVDVDVIVHKLAELACKVFIGE